jgi:hypothetical protein
LRFRGSFSALGSAFRIPLRLHVQIHGGLPHPVLKDGVPSEQRRIKNEESERALAVRRRGTREELGGAAAHHRSEHNDRRKNTNLHQHNRGGNHGNRSRTVHRNAKRALVRGAFVLMDVRHLDHRQQRQQHKAQNRHHGQSR